MISKQVKRKGKIKLKASYKQAQANSKITESWKQARRKLKSKRKASLKQAVSAKW